MNHVPPIARALTFAIHGAEYCSGAVRTALVAIEAALADIPSHTAGVRLYGNTALRPLLAAVGPVGRVAASVLGNTCKPVRAILFDKTAEANWSLAWHQDRTIAVKQRIDVPGYGPWTVKAELPHVAPPYDLLATMVTLRVHLDPVAATNAPLLVAPGSHRLGRIAETDIDDVVERCGIAACLADRGDVWLYATPILHASEAARKPARRRVLQVDYAATALPGGLEWLGV